MSVTPLSQKFHSLCASLKGPKGPLGPVGADFWQKKKVAAMQPLICLLLLEGRTEFKFSSKNIHYPILKIYLLDLPGEICDFPMNNPSWGEYQTFIEMPSWSEAPYVVEIVFDYETTIVRIFICK